MNGPGFELNESGLAEAWSAFRADHEAWCDSGAVLSEELLTLKDAEKHRVKPISVKELQPAPGVETLERLAAYALRVLEANQRLNLVSRRDPAAQILTNILDSWPMADLWGIVSRETEEPAQFIIDAGSGSGVPGIPMQILLADGGNPPPPLLLVESRGRKAEFLERSLEVLGLDRAAVWPGRLEDPRLPEWLEEEGWPAPGLLVTRGLSDLVQTQEWSRSLARGDWLSTALFVKGAPGLAREWSQEGKRWGRRGWSHPAIHVVRAWDREICYVEARKSLD